MKVGHHVTDFMALLLNGLGISSLVEEYDEMISGQTFKGGFMKDLHYHDIYNRFLLATVFRELEFEDDMSQLLYLYSRSLLFVQFNYFSITLSWILLDPGYC